jgi:hypothetical protein
MTNTNPLTASERSARALLAAWNSGELARLEAALEGIGSAALGEARPSSPEAERIELVREIADSIRAWIQGVERKTPTDLNASLKLLRHLARCEAHGFAFKAAPVRAGSETKEVLQSGTLAFVRR